MPTSTASPSTREPDATLLAMHWTVTDLLDRGLVQPTALGDTAPPEVLSGPAVLAAAREAATLELNRSATLAAGLSELLGQITIARSPQELATMLIGHKYNELGGPAGFLAATLTAVQPSTDGEGFFRDFQGGSIYWHPSSGVHEVHGAILRKWKTLGGERGFLGYPTTDQQTGNDPARRGCFNHFQHGSIYSHPTLRGIVESAVTAERAALNGGAAGRTLTSALGTSAALLIASPGAPSPAVRSLTESAAGGVGRVGMTRPGLALRPTPVAEGLATELTRVPEVSLEGTHEVHGAIRDSYLALGAEASVLGYPTSDEQSTPDLAGRASQFEAGAIYWTPTTGAHEMHGLIREFWLARRAGKSPALGYPISDELIPDRRIGHVRPEPHRKPIADVASDVIKLPAGASALGFPATVVNSKPRAMVGAPAGLGRAAESIAVGPEARAAASAALAGTFGGAGLESVSEAAPTRSANRFGDFESGVVFWQRGSTAAEQLDARLQTGDGAKMHLTTDDVVAAAQARLADLFQSAHSFTLGAVTFIGTTGYSFDGAGVHNRRHRLLVQLAARMQLGFATVPVMLAIEVQLEVGFEPTRRTIAAAFTGWEHTIWLPASGNPDQEVRDALDPMLWAGFTLLDLPDTDGGEAYAVLSVKTMQNGDVRVFVEPTPRIARPLDEATRLNRVIIR